MITMTSKSQINKRIEKKKDSEIVDAINLAKKEGHLDLAKRLSGPRSRYMEINLDELGRMEGDKILIVGKVLGGGEISKKIGVAALSFSSSAKEKLLKAGCDIKTINEALEKNKKLEGVKIV
ncbi:50S ribosomal protein L18e [Candidatus Pacearchaeota archaeon]|jgi:large subunit ribosomal protein L18e|nr:50S ribosomal protein L18e [Candidatus Pacearchaeota archaeon]|tara:strand:- start:265 stop:630 length:366 start_codon:yes stop_codon:yes gene_type:complete